MEPLISVIIPVYNKVQYINLLLSQIRNQSFKEFECLLIDDGSKDGSEGICDEYVEKDSRFKVCHIPNSGVSYARNIGLSKVKGKYITFIDADDEIHKDYLKNLYECLVISKADMVIGTYQSISDFDDVKIVKDYPLENRLYSKEELLPQFASLQKEYGMFGWCWGKIFSSDLVKEIRFNENLKLAEDFEFYLKLYPNINNICYDDKPYYYYRQSAENSSSIVLDKDIDYLSQLKINIKYREFLKSMNAYQGENEKIVNGILENYAFFILFHTPMNAYEEKFYALYDLIQKEGVLLNGKTILQRWLLCLLKNRQMQVCKLTMKVYRLLRKMVKA